MGSEMSFNLNMAVVLACYMLDIPRFVIVAVNVSGNTNWQPAVSSVASHCTMFPCDMSVVTARSVARLTCVSRWHFGANQACRLLCLSQSCSFSVPNTNAHPRARL